MSYGVACALAVASCSSATDEPVTLDVWEDLPALPVPVRAAAVATDGQRIYVVGGSTTAGRTAIVQILDLRSESWSYGASLPIPTDWGAAEWSGARLHFMGGVADGAGTTTQHFEFDPAGNEWTPSQALPAPIAGAASVSRGSSIYLFAGNSGGSPAYTSGTHIYDVDGDSWSTGLEVPGARINWAGASGGDLVYLIGGGTPGLTTSGDLLIYSPGEDSWRAGTAIPLPREAHGVGSVGPFVCAVGGRLAAAGNFNTPFDDVSCLDATTERWIPGPRLPRPRQEVAVVSVSDAIVAVGGADDDGAPVGDVTILRAR